MKRAAVMKFAKMLERKHEYMANKSGAFVLARFLYTMETPLRDIGWAFRYYAWLFTSVRSGNVLESYICLVNSNGVTVIFFFFFYRIRRVILYTRHHTSTFRQNRRLYIQIFIFTPSVLFYRKSETNEQTAKTKETSQR